MTQDELAGKLEHLLNTNAREAELQSANGSYMFVELPTEEITATP
ncbi:MAG TPA: hypothetical protein VJZ00_23245 [Thermoanaerobaculia bacterium]|nr:hypothetical protein [Thermoanaerobaculia bacterium]